MGQCGLVCADGHGDLAAVAGNGCHVAQHNAQKVDMVIQHLQDAVTAQVGDVVVTCHETGHKAAQHLAA